jgi:CubicO group peptidase (beta-lactamase class C family)
MFLGMVVEAASGQAYESYVDSHVLAPAGIPAWEVDAGHTFAANQNSREPVYSSPFTAQNVYDPHGTSVVSPYGGWDQEKALAFGGLIGSSKAIAVLAESRIASGPEIGKLRSDYTTYTNYWWYHTGSLDGTDTLMLEASWKDWTYSILFDRRPTNGSSYTDSLVTSMQNILEALNIWPGALVYSGDFTNDQWLTVNDITLFNEAVARGNETAFEAAYPTARYLAGDFDGNGIVNAFDVAGFIGALQHAGVPAEYIALVPEPATKWMFVAGILTVCLCRRRNAS